MYVHLQYFILNTVNNARISYNLNVVSLASELAYIRYQLDYLVNHFTAPKRDHEGFVVDGIDEEFAQ